MLVKPKSTVVPVNLIKAYSGVEVSLTSALMEVGGQLQDLAA
jgi:hypothetical protein